MKSLLRKMTSNTYFDYFDVVAPTNHKLRLFWLSEQLQIFRKL